MKSGCVTIPTGLPSGASRKARPSKAASVPSVAMIGLTLRTVTMRPLTSPRAAPAIMPGEESDQDRAGEQAHHALRHGDRRHDRRDAGDRADRDIKRATDDDDGLAHREQTDDHHALGEAVHQVLPRQEVLAALDPERAG